MSALAMVVHHLEDPDARHSGPIDPPIRLAGNRVVGRLEDQSKALVQSNRERARPVAGEFLASTGEIPQVLEAIGSSQVVQSLAQRSRPNGAPRLPGASVVGHVPGQSARGELEVQGLVSGFGSGSLGS